MSDMKDRLMIWIIIFAAFLCSYIKLSAQSRNANYSFLVAGHAYGHHNGVNPALHPKFLEALNNNVLSEKFIVFTGDVLRASTAEIWNTLEQQMQL